MVRVIPLSSLISISPVSKQCQLLLLLDEEYAFYSISIYQIRPSTISTALYRLVSPSPQPFSMTTVLRIAQGFHFS